MKILYLKGYKWLLSQNQRVRIDFLVYTRYEVLAKHIKPFCPLKFRPKVCANNVDFLTIKITSKKVSGNKVDFSTREITSEKTQRGFFDQRNWIDKKYVEEMWIFRPANLCQKSSWKQRGYVVQQNYTEKGTWKQRGFFDHRNYVEKSTWK